MLGTTCSGRNQNEELSPPPRISGISNYNICQQGITFLSSLLTQTNPNITWVLSFYIKKKKHVLFMIFQWMILLSYISFSEY